MSRFASLAALATLPLLLDIREYGAVGLVVAIGALVNILLPLEISQGLARFYASTPDTEKSTLAGTAWWFTCAMLTGAAAIAIGFSEFFSTLLFGTTEYRAAFVISIGFWWGGCTFLFLQNQFRWSFRTREYAIYSVAYAAALFGGAVIFAWLAPEPLLGALAGWAIAALALTVFAFLNLRGVLPTKISGTHLRQMLRFSLPLVPASIAIVATTYVSRFVLGEEGGLADVGLYTFASQLAAIPSLVILGLQSAVTPHVMANFEKPETPILLARTFEMVLIVGLAASTLLATWADPILPHIGYPSYTGAGGLILLLAPALLFQQLYIFAPGFAVAHRTAQQAIVSIASGAVAIALNFALIAPLGPQGAALATLIAATVFLLAWFAMAQRYYAIPVRWFGLSLSATGFAIASQSGRLAPIEAAPWLSAIGVLIVVGLASPVWWPAVKEIAVLAANPTGPVE